MSGIEMVDGALIMWVVSAFIGSLPEPKEDERWYGFLYRFLQVLVANLPRLPRNQPQIPPPPIVKLTQ